ncbi:MAG: helix-turn-helix transcriptional regulator [Selenomonadaceae bacterium]|nr:helix-turn-helix transcriptional regulator [Selenomonadaceae bacterium]
MKSISINERIKILRKHLNLTQKEFGFKIGITSQQQMANIERKVSKVTESNIKLICNEFGVNENWLRSGDGEMFDVSSKTSLIEKLTKEYNLNLDEKMYIESFLKASSENREKFLYSLKNINTIL